MSNSPSCRTKLKQGKVLPEAEVPFQPVVDAVTGKRARCSANQAHVSIWVAGK